jgi:hypothetical protein
MKGTEIAVIAISGSRHHNAKINIYRYLIVLFLEHYAYNRNHPQVRTLLASL